MALEINATTKGAAAPCRRAAFSASRLGPGADRADARAMLPPIVYLVNSSLHTTNPRRILQGPYLPVLCRSRRQPAFCPQPSQHDDLCGRRDERGLFSARCRLGRRANRYAVAEICLPRIDHVARHPSVLYTVAFLLLLGKTGPVNQFFESLRHQTGDQRLQHGRHDHHRGNRFSPLVFLLMSAVFGSTMPLSRKPPS